MPEAVIIWGTGDQTRVLGELLREIERTVIAVLDDDPAAAPPWPDVPVYGGPDALARFLADYEGDPPEFLVGVGGERGAVRLAIQDRLEVEGLVATVAIHPAAYVAADAVIGPGSQVLAHATIGTGARVGRACIVNTAASIDHDVVLEDGVHVGPGAVLTGGVRVECGAFIGAGAVAVPRITIGADAVVGAGAVVVRDVAAGVVAVGNPARCRERITGSAADG